METRFYVIVEILYSGYFLFCQYSPKALYDIKKARDTCGLFYVVKSGISAVYCFTNLPVNTAPSFVLTLAK